MRLSILVSSLALSVAILTGSAGAHEYKVGSLTIEHPWTRATPPGAKVAAGYFVIDNAGQEPERLLSATADVSDNVQIHQSLTTNGVSSMRSVEGGVEIPPGGSVAFKPDSFHLMMTGIKRPLKEKERVPGTLLFEKAGAVKVEFAVEAAGATPDMKGMSGM